MPSPIKTYSIEGVEELVKEAGLPSFRSFQLLQWIYEKGVTSYSDMSNLPKVMRKQLEEFYPLHYPELLVKQVSRDGSRKYLIKYEDDSLVEAVGLPSDDGRLTVCCSSQSGCAMGCQFCATGKLGLTRSLGPGEIVDQILVVQKDFGQRVTNVVVMGQGEPFANYDSTLAALRIMNHPKLLGIGARHITLSTCGIIEGIRKFVHEDEQFTLAVSLHAARQEVRDKLMPGMKGQPLAQLKDVLNEYAQRTGRRFTFEYALMKDVNNDAADLDSLISYCKGMLCHVNLIPLNEVKESPFKPVGKREMTRWKEKLEQEGIPSTVRRSQGEDIDAACGQLSSDNKDKV